MYNRVNVFAKGITLPGQMYQGEPINDHALQAAAIYSVGNLASYLVTAVPSYIFIACYLEQITL
jgi:hypothetical protein